MRGTSAWGIAAVGLTALAVAGFHLGPVVRPPSFTTAFFLAAAFVLVSQLALAAKGRRFDHRPIATGRVVAVVPTFNEEPELLQRCVASLLAGTVVPDRIHVVDDGSAIPVTPFEDPRVIWHSQVNLGKRAAQVTGLNEESGSDFILTVDSDSIADPGALEAALRAMSDPAVQAVTAMCLVRNRTDNMLTRLADLEIVTGNMVYRRARSVLGVVAPTSGPFALYRAPIFFDNLRDYLASGTYGDDRRLTHYALLRGQVVASDEAVVEMSMPTTARTLVRQRTRWFQGYFRYLGWEIRYLSGAALAWRVWNLVLLATFPVVAAYALLVVPFVQGRVFWEGWAYWIVLLYAQTLLYLGGRPGMSRRDRLATWLLLTPFLLPYQLGLVRPAMYRAMTMTHRSEWGTRGQSAASATPAGPIARSPIVGSIQRRVVSIPSSPLASPSGAAPRP